MKIKNFFKHIFKLFIISIIIVCVTLFISFLLGTSPSNFDTILLRTSGIIFIIGSLSIIGAFKSTMNFNYLYCRTVNNKHTFDNVNDDFKDRNKSFDFFFSTLIISLMILGYKYLITFIVTI